MSETRTAMRINGVTVPVVILSEMDAIELLRPRQFTQKEAAKYLRLSVNTFRALGAKPNKLGRYTVESLQEYLKPAL